MSQLSPFNGFEWCATSHITEEWILSLPDDSEIGYIFEVDLKYTKKLHKFLNEYPLASERVTVNEGMSSSYAQSLLSNRKFVGTAKVISNLNDKQKYTVYYRNLKYYLELGLKLTGAHEVLNLFLQPWCLFEINFNTEKRKEAKSSFEKDFFKLNNSVFGKTMENLRKRNIVLCNNEKRAEKLVAMPTFKTFKTYDEDLTVVERHKTSILMNRPVYVHFAILELSKLLFINFTMILLRTIETKRDYFSLLRTP